VYRHVRENTKGNRLFYGGYQRCRRARTARLPSTALKCFDSGFIAPAVEVSIEDANGVVATSATNLVKLNLTGVFGLGGTLEIAARNGVATFNNLSVSTAGSYTLTASSPGLISATSVSFIIVAQAINAPVPPTFFGLTVGQVGIISPIMHYGTTRSWDDSPDLSWSAANPSPDVYNFAPLDDFINYYQARGVDMIYTLARTPQWASSQPDISSGYGPGQCAPPGDLGDWDDYLKAIVTHAAGKIKYWELWNEPQDPQYYCGDIPTMVTMAQHAVQIIKAIDSTALILSPAVTGPDGPAWLSTFPTDGGSATVDVIAFHGYWSATAEDILTVIANYKSVMQTSDVAGKPMWDTEASWAGSGNLPTPTLAQQASFLSKYYLLHWSQGINRFAWYSYQGAYWGGLMTSSGGPSSTAVAYEQTYLWMVGALMTQPCSENASAIWTCLFTRPGGYQAEAIWITGSSATLDVPSQYVEYRDLAGTVHPMFNQTVTIGDQPYFWKTVLFRSLRCYKPTEIPKIRSLNLLVSQHGLRLNSCCPVRRKPAGHQGHHG
jgi:polysaccharide biosynthesis protein PslG